MQIRSVLVMLSIIFPLVAFAGISPKSGNFYITYDDIDLVRDGHKLGITRTYNSKSSYDGWFGYGWSSPYETRLVILPDGSAAVEEGGGGSTTNYRIKNESATRAGVKRIVAEAVAVEKLSAEDAAKLEASLLINEELRLQQVEKYKIYSELPEGATLGDVCGAASLIRVANTYVRNDCNRFGDSVKTKDTFDLKGRLIKREFDVGYFVSIKYTDKGDAEIRDSLDQSIALEWTKEGRVLSASTKGKIVTYTYVNKDLTLANTIGGIYYKYSYDINHNLTLIHDLFGSDQIISYSPTILGQALSVTDSDGSQETFSVRLDPADKNHYWTKHTLIPAKGKASSKEYEINNSVSKTGVTSTSETSESNGSGAVKTEYDDQGRIIRRSRGHGGEFIEYKYQSTINKPTEVKSGSNVTGMAEVVNFSYDSKGNVISIANNTHDIFDFTYDTANQIIIVVERRVDNGSTNKLTMEYDTNGLKAATIFNDGSNYIKLNQNGDVVKSSKRGNDIASLRRDMVKMTRRMSRLSRVSDTWYTDLLLMAP